MTALKKPVRRVTQNRLDSFFGADRGRRIVVTLIPGNGTDVDDTIELRPEGTRRPEYLKVSSAYRVALHGRVNAEHMAVLREKKAQKERKKKERALAREIRRINRK